MQKRLTLLISLLVLASFVGGCNKAEKSPQAQVSTETETVTASSKTVEPIPGWKKFEGQGVELWLPESYNGGDPSSKDLDLIVEKLESLGPNFAPIAATIKQNPGLFKFWAFDSNVSESGFLTNVNVTSEQVPSVVTMEAYLQAASSQLPSQFTVVEKGVVALDNHPETGRIVTEMEINSVQVKQVVYIIKNEDKMWVVSGSTGMKDFEQRLPEFQQSIETLRIVQE